MSWIIPLLILVIGYFIGLLGAAWVKGKRNIREKRAVLIMVFRNSGKSAEAIIWDLFRLKSWRYHDLNFIVVDDKSDDDTLLILKALQKKHPFILINSTEEKSFDQIMGYYGKGVPVLRVDGAESPSAVRKKIIFLLNQYYQETELFKRKYS